ncbi:hypothetical protein FWG76_00320 [Candidatus Saccharibacteria bacterium]|nr:hypothetical protein [Candidatus Saccharibacteria bacterium]
MKTEFQIPNWQATSAEPTAAFAVQKTAISGKTVIMPGQATREAVVSENDMILEILRIGNEVEALRVKKIGEKHVWFSKTTRTAG